MGKIKTIKMWAVIWTKRGAREYGGKEKDIVVGAEIELLNTKRERVFLYSNMALFRHKRDARKYANDGSKGTWAVIPVQVVYEVKKEAR